MMLLAVSLGRTVTGLVYASLGVNHFPAYLLPVFQNGPSTLVLYGAAADIAKVSRSADVDADGSFRDYLFLGPHALYVGGSMGYPMADPRDTEEHRRAYKEIALKSVALESIGGVLYLGPSSEIYRFFNVTTLTPLWLRLDEAPRPLDVLSGFSLNDDVEFSFDAIPSTRDGVGDWTSTGADQGDWLLGDLDGGILSEPLTRRQVVSYNATSGEVAVGRGTVPARRNVPGTIAVAIAGLSIFLLWISLAIDRHFTPQLVVIALITLQVLIAGATEAVEILANYVGVPWWAIAALWYVGTAMACVAALYRVRIQEEYTILDQMTGVKKRTDDVRTFYAISAGVLAWALIGIAPTHYLALLGGVVLGILALGVGISSVLWGLDPYIDGGLLILGIAIVYLGAVVPVTTYFVPGNAERWVVSAYGMVMGLAIEVYLLHLAHSKQIL